MKIHPSRTLSSLGSLAALALLALAVGSTVGACGDEPAPEPDAGVVDAGDEASEIDLEAATPEQKKALANPLHIAHLEAEEEPAKCRDCHQIKGHEPTEPGYGCKDCHDDLKSAMHSNLADPAARECMTCHFEWMEKDIDPWTCQGCHTKIDDPPELKVEIPKAPVVQVHAEEACNSCHLAHGDERIELGACLECHEEQTSTHHADELSDPAQCAECHESHDRAEVAKTMCVDCHLEDVPTRTALFEGHDDCVSCHAPHDQDGIIECQSCHEDTRTVGMREHPEHADCGSCHNPHQVSQSPEASCVGCHEDVSVQHPEDEDHGTCVGCHPSHPFRGRLVIAKQCTACHDEAQTETSFHSGETCGDCHQPHGFDLSNAGNVLCSECHLDGMLSRVESAAQTIVVNPIDEHSNCDECHIDAAHEPLKQVEACATCHEPVAQSMTAGHEDCGECHLPHEATVETTCKDCHEPKWTSRHETDGTNCEECHRAHGPEGVAEPVACVTCHDEKLPLLHQHEEHQNCADCHDFHDRGPQRQRSTCLGACHADMVDHEPSAVSCVGCHPFEVDVPNWLRVEETEQ